MSGQIMDEKMKELLTTILEKNGIGLSPKDPIMVVHTALDFLLKKQIEEQNKIVSLFRTQVEEVTTKWQQSINQQSEAVVKNHLDVTQEQARKLAKLLLQETNVLLEEKIEQAVADFEGKLHGINDTALNTVERKVKETRNTALLNLVSSLIILLAVIILTFKFVF